MVNPQTDTAYGLIPVLTSPEGDRRYLLILHQKGHWAFPKGHADPGETPLETARREVAEETGLTDLTVVPGAEFVECYQLTHQDVPIAKTVTYFLAQVHAGPDGAAPIVTLQEAEVAQYQWCSPAEAEELLTFAASRQILANCEAFFQG
ncbi:MAG: NUDIX domain-containing protein [Prochlorothrix sp.]|nr:NUDIX domain-containing protein [Prochlorothrix sp.]